MLERRWQNGKEFPDCNSSNFTKQGVGEGTQHNII